MWNVEGKVVVLGPQGVGKTSLITQCMGKMSNEVELSPTVGALFYIYKFWLSDVKIRLNIWDTAGQERFRSMVPMYYRNANAAMLVFDLTDYNSFEAIKRWVTELQQNVEESMVLLVIGNKSDMKHEREVNSEEGRKYATKIGATYHETSALLSDIDDVLITIGQGLIQMQIPDHNLDPIMPKSWSKLNDMPLSPSLEESPQKTNIAHGTLENPFTCC